jgi:hypothetical protein
MREWVRGRRERDAEIIFGIIENEGVAWIKRIQQRWPRRDRPEKGWVCRRHPSHGYVSAILAGLAEGGLIEKVSPADLLKAHGRPRGRRPSVGWRKTENPPPMASVASPAARTGLAGATSRRQRTVGVLVAGLVFFVAAPATARWFQLVMPDGPDIILCVERSRCTIGRKSGAESVLCHGRGVEPVHVFGTSPTRQIAGGIHAGRQACGLRCRTWAGNAAGECACQETGGWPADNGRCPGGGPVDTVDETWPTTWNPSGAYPPGCADRMAPPPGACPPPAPVPIFADRKSNDKA